MDPTSSNRTEPGPPIPAIGMLECPRCRKKSLTARPRLAVVLGPIWMAAPVPAVILVVLGFVQAAAVVGIVWLILSLANAFGGIWYWGGIDCRSCDYQNMFR